MRFSVKCAFPYLGKRGAVSRKSAFCPDRLTERRTLRFPDRANCAFPLRCGAREVWGNPPARLRGTMENASTGQTRSSNHPPACGAGCARVRKSRFGVWPYGKAHSAQPVGFRMRFSVTTRPQNALFREGAAQNALFRKVRLSSPGQTSKSLTEKRTLQPRCHQKAHSVPITSRKGSVWLLPHLDVPQHLTYYGIKDLFVASMKADDKVWEP